MPVSGNQVYMRAGSRMLFQRDPIGGTIQGTFDLGTIKTANPTRSPQEVTLFDGDGGVNQLVASAVTQIDETYSIVTNNFNPHNLALLFSANPAEAYTVTAGDVQATMQYAGPGTLLKLKNLAGEFVYDVQAILGFYVVAELQGTLTAINATANTLTVTQDFSTLAANSYVIVGSAGLAAAANAGTYKITGTSGNGPTTLTYDPAVKDAVANETAITGTALGSAIANAVLKYKTDWDFDTAGLRRGYAKILDTSTNALAGNITGVYQAKAITGKRLIKPQTVSSEVKGQLFIYWSEDNFGRELVREARATITPGNTNIQVEQFSEATLTVKLLTDLSSSTPSGRLILTVGNVPPGVV